MGPAKNNIVDSVKSSFSSNSFKRLHKKLLDKSETDMLQNL